MELTAVVLIDHQFQALTEIFLVETSPSDLIYHLKKKVKEAKPVYFSRLAFDVNELVVWKTMGAKVINEHTQENMTDILSTINVNDKGTIRRLFEMGKLADLGLEDFQTLLVQLPGTSRISTIVGRALIQV
jgi:guanylate kinase